MATFLGSPDPLSPLFHSAAASDPHCCRNPRELVLETRLYHDGKQVYAGAPAPFQSTGQTGGGPYEIENRLTLGSQLEPGEYVLQVVVTDKLAPKKAATVSQSTDFEIRP